jgi:hypothetical protein
MALESQSVVRIPSQLDYDTFENAFIRQFRRAMESRAKHIVFDLTATRWADLMEAMALGIASSHAIASGKEVSFELGPTPGTASAETFIRFLQNWYLIAAWKRTGAFLRLDQRDTIDTERLLPVQDLADTELSKLTQDLRSRIRFYFPDLPRAQVESLVDAIAFEAAENAVLHSYDSPVRTAHDCRYIAVRRVPSRVTAPGTDYKSYWIRTLQHVSPNTDFVEITVADGGVGIYHRLREQHEIYQQRRAPHRQLLPSEITEALCLTWALSESRSSHLPGPRRGYGLFRIITHAVQGWNGALYLRSGETRIAQLPNSPPAIDHGLAFPGTQIRVFLPLRNREIQLADVNLKLAKTWESE